jgi:tetratricopeptide (TPR) repeat protein
LGIILALLVTTVLVYAPVREYAFVNYDDPSYVAANPHVPNGLTADGLRWALTSFEDGNWFPMTWMSHMLDVEFFGLDSGAHHVTNVVLHVGSTLLLFGLLLTMTGARWPSALVAFIFAVHPQHVEPVAWIAGRKDVLNGIFWMVTIWAYVWYARRATWARYAVVIVTFALGLMTKATIVTLPVVLLLLDVWPLTRLVRSGGEPSPVSTGRAPRTMRQLVLEKLPLLALAGGTALVAYTSRTSAGAVSSLDVIPLATRIANALVSYVGYLGDMIWPAGLAVFYPHPLSVPLWQFGPALVVLAIVSGAVYRMRHARPYLIVGWLWYVLTLLPVSGLVQLGPQARADRFMYIPSIGIAVMMAWGLAELWTRRDTWRRAVVGVTVAACAVLMLLTSRQVQTWRDSTTLFQHAVEVTAGNYVAHNNLGLAMRERGQVDDAISHYESAIAINPRHASAHNNLGEVLLALGRPGEAVPRLEQARRLQPERRDVQINLGNAYSSLGRIDEAVAQYRDVVRRWPEVPQGHSGLGIALAGQGRYDEAATALADAVRLAPDYADGHFNLGLVLTSLGRVEEAASEFAEVVRLQPTQPDAHFNLANALAAAGRYDEAVIAYTTAIRLRPDYARAYGNLGTTLVLMGDLEGAIARFQEALVIDPSAVEIQQNLDYALSIRR